MKPSLATRLGNKKYWETKTKKVRHKMMSWRAKIKNSKMTKEEHTAHGKMMNDFSQRKMKIGKYKTKKIIIK